MVKCAGCETEFRKFEAEIRKNQGGLHFCSSDCWYAHNRSENHYMWTGGQDERMNPEGLKWRKAVLSRDKYRCRVCFSQERLEVHHIHPFGEFPDRRWDLANGLTLCHECHAPLRRRELEFAEILTFMATVPLVVWNVEHDEDGDPFAPAEVLSS
jgi:hypothetical protein